MRELDDEASIETMASVAELWSRWKLWLSRNAPELVDGLGAPATEDAIARVEKALKTPLPESLKALYAACDGAARIVGGYDIATLEQLVATRELLMRLEGAAAARYFPFVDHHSGDHYAVNAAGQVIELSHDGQSGAQLAASLEAWMASIIGDLERGLYRWNAAETMFEPETIATGFRWLSTEDGRRHAFVLEPGTPVARFDGDGWGLELASVSSLEPPDARAILWIERDGERIWQRPIAELGPGEDSGPGERAVDQKVADFREVAIGVDGCDQRYYLFRQPLDPIGARLARGLADLKRFTSAADVDAAVAQIGELAAVGFEGRAEQAAVLYKACARAALELASGSAVFDATRLVRALLPHAGAVGGEQAHRWHFARAAVDVAVAGNDPELVREIDRDLVPALDLAAVTGPDETPEGVAALYNLACLYARFGDRDGCLRYAELALERGSRPDEIRADPDFDPFARDPELVALLGRFG